jgi:hypothetical protein
MNINIEKIENGFVVTIGSKKTFCDCAEAICGVTSQWVLDECDRLEKSPKVAYTQYMALAQAQADNA